MGLAECLALERCDQRIKMGAPKRQGGKLVILLGLLDTIDIVGHSLFNTPEFCFRLCCPLESHKKVFNALAICQSILSCVSGARAYKLPFATTTWVCRICCIPASSSRFCWAISC